MTSQLNYKGTFDAPYIDSRGIVEQADSTAKNPVGIIHRHNGRLYRYVKFSTGAGAVASVAGAPCYYKAEGATLQADLDANTLQVTSDYSDSLAVFAGVLLKAAITTGTYIWILIAGVITVVVNDDTTVKSDKIIATADATFTRADAGAATTYAIWGILLTDRAAEGTASALIYPKQLW